MRPIINRNFLQGFLLAILMLVTSKLADFYIWHEPFNPSVSLLLGYLALILFFAFGWMIIFKNDKK